MSQVEFQRWFDFYQLHPFDDLHRFHRPAALVATAFSGGDTENMIQWLHPQYNTEAKSEYSEADLNTLKALGMTDIPRRK